MSLGKQAKVLNSKQVDAVLNYINGLRYGLRNQVVLLLSVRAGLRAKEIAGL
jgi:integrase/recombinase XerD